MCALHRFIGGLDALNRALLLLYADRFDHSRVLKRLADDVAGRSLAAAMGFLDEVARFEED